jgi:acetolactate synthase-1/2/3 large subunit
MTTGEAAVATLVANGIDTVYCLPGVQNDHLFDALHGAQDQVRIVHTRHEQGAAYMALGAAMATGKPNVYAVVPGPGFLNTTGALCTPYAVNAPVLALVGQIPAAAIGRGYGLLHEIPDQLGIMRGLTKYADRIHAPHDGPVKVNEAFRQMISDRPRPAALECALDVWARRAPVSLPGPAAADNALIDPDLLARAAKMLGQARNPLIIVGGGAQHASAEITALAELLQAPVIAHRMGHGVVDRRNPLSANLVEGHALWEHADVVLGIGTRLNIQYMQWGTDAEMKIIRIDADAQELDRYERPAISLCGDAAAVARGLLDAVPAHNRARASRREELLALRAKVAEQLAFCSRRSATCRRSAPNCRKTASSSMNSRSLAMPRAWSSRSMSRGASSLRATRARWAGGWRRRWG